jgi:hypothetical protein
VRDDVGDHPPEAVADRDHSGAVELGGLDVQKVVRAPVGQVALEDVQRGQLAGLLDPQAGLDEQLQQRPVPERVALGALRPSIP